MVRSDMRGIVQLLWHISLLTTTVTLNVASFHVLAILASMLQGIVMVALFAPLHECVHRTAFADRHINDWVASIIGFLLFLPANYFRLFHFAHHRYTQIEGKDPELAAAKPRTKAEYVLVMTAVYYWLRQFEYLVTAAMGYIDADFVPEKRKPELIREARWHVGLYAVIIAVPPLFDIWWVFQYWLLPVALGQPFLRFYLLAEHGGLELIPDMLKTPGRRPAISLFGC